MVLLETVAFALGIASAVVILATLLVTVLGSPWRFWPPGEKSWKYRLHWGSVTVFNVALLATAVLDWNTWILPRPSSLVAGGVLAVVGMAVFVASERRSSVTRRWDSPATYTPQVSTLAHEIRSTPAWWWDWLGSPSSPTRFW